MAHLSAAVGLNSFVSKVLGFRVGVARTLHMCLKRAFLHIVAGVPDGTG